MLIEFLKSIFSIVDADTITSAFVVVILSIAFIAIVYVIYETIKWNKIIDNQDFKIPELKDYYDKYKATFIGETGKTHVHANEIFSLENLRPTYNVIRSIPNMLIGIGILGTFIGLTAGLGSLEVTGDSEALMKGATDLLSGMTTAFMTSVFGMASSLILGLVLRYQFGTTYKRCKKMWNDLDNKHFISDDEKEFVELDRLKIALIETFGKEVDGNNISPGSLLWNVSNSGEKTVAQLEAFSSELADGLMLSTDTIQAIQDKLGTSFSNLFDGKMQPLFEKMVDHLETIRNKNEDDTSKFIGELKDSLNEMVAIFQNQISEGATDQVKELNGIMLQTANSLSSIPDMLESTSGNFKEMLSGFEGAGDEIIKRMMDSYEKAANDSLEAQTKVINSSQNVVSEITKASTQATVEISYAVNSIVEKQVKVSGELDLLLGRFTSIMEGTAETQESISSHIRELLSASSGIKSAAKDLETIFSRTNDVMQQTVKVSELLESSSSSLSEAQLEFKDIAFRNFEETKSYLDTHLNSFEQLKTQTSSLFEEINKGINTYQTGASASINQYLGDFANELEGAANSLSGAYTSLNDTIEEIGDLFEKINNKKN